VRTGGPGVAISGSLWARNTAPQASELDDLLSGCYAPTLQVSAIFRWTPLESFVMLLTYHPAPAKAPAEAAGPA
jgi:hypothetical protein